MSKMVVTVSGSREGTWYQTLGRPIPAAELKGLISQCNQAEFAIAQSSYMSFKLKLLKLTCYTCGFLCFLILIGRSYDAAVERLFGEPQWLYLSPVRFTVTLLLSLLVIELIIRKLDETLICEKIVLIPKLGVQCETICYTRSVLGLIRTLWYEGDSPSLEQQIWESGFGNAYSQKRFYPLDRVLDIVINECFKGFQVVSVMQMLVKSDTKEKEFDITLVFPELLPRHEFLETVWRATREFLDKANI